MVRDDVDALAAQLADDDAHPRAARPDAGADGIHPIGVGDHSDLAAAGGGLAVPAAIAGFPRHVLDLHETVGDLGHLKLEQLAQNSSLRRESLTCGPLADSSTRTMTALMRAP